MLFYTVKKFSTTLLKKKNAIIKSILKTKKCMVHSLIKIKNLNLKIFFELFIIFYLLLFYKFVQKNSTSKEIKANLLFAIVQYAHQKQ